MAAPTLTARTVPTGTHLDYGMRMTIAFSANAAVNFWEKDPQPPGWDGGEATDITNQFNTHVRTFAPRVLHTITDPEVTVAYDPATLSEIQALINTPGSVSFHFPNSSAWSFYGYLQKFIPDKFEDGKQPEAKVTIKITNWDSVNKLEVQGVYAAAGGTP